MDALYPAENSRNKEEITPKIKDVRNFKRLHRIYNRKIYLWYGVIQIDQEENFIITGV